MIAPRVHALRRTIVALLMVASIACATIGIVPPPVSAQSSNPSSSAPTALAPQSTGKLSWRLASLAQTGIGTQSIDATTRDLSVASTGAGSLVQNNAGAILTYIRVADTSAATLAALRASGAQIMHVSTAYNTVTAYIVPNQLNGVTGLNVVANIQEALRAGVDANEQVDSAVSPTSAQQLTCAQKIVSEGDQQLHAANARIAFGVDGSGTTVGVLSDSYDTLGNTQTNAASDVASGELPGLGNPCGYTTPVNVVAESPTTSGDDEGRAMLQIVHDIAPGAKLDFATTTGGMFAFADNVRKLRQAGADVIVDDVGYLQEPFYQDGPVSVAIHDVTVQGAIYVKSAGNSHIVDATGQPIGSYEAPYRSTPCAIAASTGDCHAFNAATNDSTMGISLAAGGGFTIALQWAQPWYNVETDLDLLLIDQQDKLVARSTNVNTGANGTQMPYESFTYKNTSGAAQTVNLVIQRVSGPAVPALKYVFARSSGIVATEYTAANSNDSFGSTVIGHATAADALSVGAIAYNASNVAESFSSRGTATLYFAPVNGTTPSAPLAAPVVRSKPDVLATDGNRNTFFGVVVDGVHRFYGTSAAAPHVAAVAALMWEHARQHGTQLDKDSGAALLKSTALYTVQDVHQSSAAGLVNALTAGYTIQPVAPIVPVTSYTALQFLPFINK